MAEDQKELRIGAKVDKGDFREVILAFKEVERAANSMADALNRAASGIGGAGGIGAGAAGAATTAVGGVASATGAGPAGRGSSLGREIKGIRTEIRALIEDMNRLKREAQDFRSVVTSVGASTVAARGTTMTVSAAAGTGSYTTTPAGQISGPATAPTTVSGSGGTPPPPSGAPPATAGGGGGGIAQQVASTMNGLGTGLALTGAAISGVATMSQMAMTLPLEMNARSQSLNRMLGQSILSGKLSDAYYYQQMGGYAGMMQNYNVRDMVHAQMLGRTMSGMGSIAAGIGGIAAGMAGGATIGSIVPGLGTVAGGAIGGILGGMATSSGVSNIVSGAGTVASTAMQFGAGGAGAEQEAFLAKVLNLAKEQRPFTTMGIDLYAQTIPARLQMQRQFGAMPKGGVDRLYGSLMNSFAGLGFQTPEEQIGITAQAARRFGPMSAYGDLSESARKMVPHGFDYGSTLSAFGAIGEATRSPTSGLEVVESMYLANKNIPKYVMEHALGAVSQERTTIAGRMSEEGFMSRGALYTRGLPEGANMMDLEQRVRGVGAVGGVSSQSSFMFGATYEKLRSAIPDPMVRKIIAEAPLKDVTDPKFLASMGISPDKIPEIQKAKIDPLAIGITGKQYQDVKKAGGLTSYIQGGGDLSVIARQLVATQGARVGGDIETATSGLKALADPRFAQGAPTSPVPTDLLLPTPSEMVTDTATKDIATTAPKQKAALMEQGRLNVQTQQISKILGNLAQQILSASQSLTGMNSNLPAKPTTATAVGK